MASLWQKTLFYLGLVDEDQAEQVEADAETRARAADTSVAGRQSRLIRADQPAASGGPVAGRRVDPPLAARRRISTDGAMAEAGVIVTSDTSSVRTLTDSDLESEVIVARSYSDAQALADHIRANIPVVLDLRKIEPAMVRRLVDFASGLTYALGGSMRKIAQGVILVSPPNVNISRDERRRLTALGYYQEPEGS